MNHTTQDDIDLTPDAPRFDGGASESDSSESSDRKRAATPMLLLGEILLAGTAGWKQLRRARISPEKAAEGCFYPLVALGAACKFAAWFHQPEFSVAKTVVEAVTFFASFFFAYFAVQVACRWLFPAEARGKTELPYFKLVVQYALASLALFCVPAELFPILAPIAVFLPIWTAFIITKAVRFLRFPESCKNRCLVTLALATILTPYLFIWIGSFIF